MGVYIAGIGELAAWGAVHAVDLSVGEGLQRWKLELLSECVDPRMSKELLATTITGGERVGSIGFRREGVVMGVLELEEATKGFDVLGGELDATLDHRIGW